MAQSKLEAKWQIFIGHAHKQGATKEELEVLVKVMDLIRKYQPIKKSPV